MDEKPVCILGCGPAGLFAAQAIELMGGQPLIFSVKQKSEIYGAQFLHEPIPGLTAAASLPEQISIIKFGVETGYAQRVYGDPRVETSWSKMLPVVFGWSLQDTYDAAWEKWEPLIIDQKLDYEEVEDMTARFPVVISTVPLWSICNGSHEFKSRDILVCKKAVEIPVDGSYIVYNGGKYGDWYRASRIFGVESTEATSEHELLPDVKEASEDTFGVKWQSGFKVVSNNCDCHPNLTRAGRLGKWERGVLTHHAFHSAVEAYTEAMAV